MVFSKSVYLTNDLNNPKKDWYNFSCSEGGYYYILQKALFYTDGNIHQIMAIIQDDNKWYVWDNEETEAGPYTHVLFVDLQ